MTVSELEQWEQIFGFPEQIEPCIHALVADWKAMYIAIYELLNTDNDLAYGNCAIVLNRLRLKP